MIRWKMGHRAYRYLLVIVRIVSLNTRNGIVFVSFVGCPLKFRQFALNDIGDHLGYTLVSGRARTPSYTIVGGLMCRVLTRPRIHD